MSGGGGSSVEGMLPVAAALAATVMTDGAAAPMLGEALGAGTGIGATMLGSSLIGAGVGGASSALTGGNVLQGVLTGGVTGAATSGISGLLGGATPTGDVTGQIGSNITSMVNAPGADLTQVSQSLQDTYGMTPNQAQAAINQSMVNPTGTTGGINMAGANAADQSAGISSNVGPASQTIQNPNALTKGILGTGITSTQAMLGLGGLGLYSAINNQNKKYGTIPASTVNAVPADLNYAPNLPARPMNLTPTYADGGQVDQQSLNGGPVPQKLMDNATGQNMMFPQPGVHSSHFTNPTNTPTPGNILTTATDTSVDPYTGQQLFAAGGIAGLNAFAGGGNLGGYSDGGQYLQGPGDGMSDSIPAHIDGKQPARLADSEFVIPADVVSHLGNGSSDAGAKKLYSMMDKVRMARTGRKSQGKEINADKYLPT